VDHFEIASEAGLPIRDEIRSQLLEPFITAMRTALAEMAGAAAVARAATRTQRPPAWGDLSIVVRLTSATDGFLVLSFPQRTAAALTEQVLTGEVKEIDGDLIGDCVGEIANVVAGQAKTLLGGTPYHFSFSVSQVVNGCAPELEPHAGRDWLVVVFGTDVGEIAMQLLLHGPESTTVTTSPPQDMR
jgi:chemotaxis protein CheX